MGKVRIGVVGVGSVAENKYLPLIREHADKMELVAVCDIDAGRAREMRSRFGAQSSFTDIRAMLEGAVLDCAVVLTPGPRHPESLIPALEAGKHVFVEKPLAMSLEEADRIIDLAKENNVKLGCAPAIAVCDQIEKIRRTVRAGQIGKISYARANFSHRGPTDIGRLAPGFTWPDPTWFMKDGYGPLQDMSVYPLTSLTSVLGPARKVSAMLSVSLPTRTAYGGPMDGRTVRCESHDGAHLLLQFADEVYATVSATFTVWASKSPSLEIYGDCGTISTGPEFSDDPQFQVYMENIDTGVSGWVSPIWGVQPFVLASGVSDLVDSILEDREPRVSAIHSATFWRSL
jgi:predicted dehydrogenase